MEAFSEKFRAAFTRRDVAIRDFHDIDYASRNPGLYIEDEEFISLGKQMLSVPGNYHLDISQPRLDVIRQQLEGQLRPVSRERDYSDFNLERAIQTVIGMAGNVSLLATYHCEWDERMHGGNKDRENQLPFSSGSQYPLLPPSSYNPH